MLYRNYDEDLGKPKLRLYFKDSIRYDPVTFKNVIGKSEAILGSEYENFRTVIGDILSECEYNWSKNSEVGEADIAEPTDTSGSNEEGGKIVVND